MIYPIWLLSSCKIKKNDIFSQLLFVHINKKYLLLEKGMVATIMFQCTSFRSDKVVSNQVLVHVYRSIMSSLKSCI